MKTKEYNKVDQAWNLLYERLERDGLLADSTAIGQPDQTAPLRVAKEEDRQPTAVVKEVQQAFVVEKEIQQPFATAKNQTKKHLFSMKWTAAIAAMVVGIVALAVFYTTGRQLATDSMLVLHNAKGDPTLVTSFEDGSIVYLAEQGSVEYPMHFADDKREVSLNGNAFFEVSKNRQRPFIIQTQSATVEVLGTSFRVKSADNEHFSLSVRTGLVKVTSKTDHSTVLVKAGETVWFEEGALQTAPTASMDAFDNYLRHIHFKDQHLSDVARIINENTDSVQLKIDPSLGERQITITFQNDSPETMARIICTVMNLQFNRQQNIINITRKE